MPRKRYKDCRQADAADAIRQIGVNEVTTFCRWRQELGRLKSDQVKRLKDLELGNS